MADIIEIKINNPYLVPNYDYIVDQMENHGCIVVTDDRLKGIIIGRNITRRGYKFRIPKRGKELWAVILEKPADTEVKLKEKKEKAKLLDASFKLLEASKEVVVRNLAQIYALSRIYQKKFPDGKKKIRRKAETSGGYTIWLE